MQSKNSTLLKLAGWREVTDSLYGRVWISPQGVTYYDTLVIYTFPVVAQIADAICSQIEEDWTLRFRPFGENNYTASMLEIEGTGNSRADAVLDMLSICLGDKHD